MSHRLRRHLRQALSCLRQTPYAAALAAVTVALALTLAGLALLLALGVESGLRSYALDARITAFLPARPAEGEPPPDPQRLAVLAAEAAGPGATASFVTPDAALSRLRAELGELGEALDSLSENPLPPSIEVRLGRAEGRTVAEVHAAAARIAALGFAEDVEYGRSFVERLEALLRGVRVAGLALFALVLAVAVFLVGNVIRLTVWARREEIEILRLCGATDGFVAAPFVLEGALQGLFGGVMGALAVHALERELLPRVAASAGFAAELMPPPLPGWTGPALAAGGLLLALCASFLAVRRFLRGLR